MVDRSELFDAKLDTIVHDIDHANDRCDNLENRMEKIEDRYDILYEMTSSLKILSDKMETVDNKIEDLKTDFKNDISVVREKQDQHEQKLSMMESAPLTRDHKMVQTMKDRALTIIITGVIVALLSYLFPMISW